MASDVFPLYENYGEPTEVHFAELLKGEGRDFAISGWVVQRAYRTYLHVKFADSHDPSLDGVQIRHGEDLDAERLSKLRPVSAVTIPITHLFAKKGGATLEVEIADISSNLARVWADSMVLIGSIETTVTQVPSPMGRARSSFAHGVAGTVDLPDSLVRVVIDPGYGPLTADATSSARERRAIELTEHSAAILHDLVV